MAGITDKEVRSLIAKAKSEGRTATQADGTIPGLTITVSKTRLAAWVLRYYVQGRRRESTIGQYPTWGISDARDKAKKLRMLVDDGVDVALEKQKKKQEALQAKTYVLPPRCPRTQFGRSHTLAWWRSGNRTTAVHASVEG